VPFELCRPRYGEVEQAAAYYIDTHPLVDAFVKNASLGFAIPYLYNGQMHDYMPDFIIRLKTDPWLPSSMPRNKAKGRNPCDSPDAGDQECLSGTGAGR
jgi:hypothetical protein